VCENDIVETSFWWEEHFSVGKSLTDWAECFFFLHETCREGQRGQANTEKIYWVWKNRESTFLWWPWLIVLLLFMLWLMGSPGPHLKRYFSICVSTLIRYKNCCKVPKMYIMVFIIFSAGEVADSLVEVKPIQSRNLVDQIHLMYTTGINKLK